MMTRLPRRGLLALAAAAVALTGAGFVVATGDADPQLSREAPASPAARSGTGARAVPAAAPAATPKPRVPRARAVGDATAQIRRNGPAVKSVPGETYRVVDAVVDAGGSRHVRFTRTHRGRAVLGGDFVVHTAANGAFVGATLAQQKPIDVPAAAAVDRKRAIAAARQRVAGRPVTATARQVVDAFAGDPVLAWEVTLTGRAESLVVVVDATTGAVRRTFDGVHTAEEGTGHGLLVGDVPLTTTRKDDGAYLLADPSRGGTTVRDALNKVSSPQPGTSAELTDADNVWGDGTPADRATVAVDVHYGLARTWDYLRDTFGRSGIGNDGKGVTAYVHQGVNYANAVWSGTCRCLYFGDGPAGGRPYTSIDVVAHEMSHGLDSVTANLANTGETGGLGEASAGILGTLVEFAANHPADRPDYLIGETVKPGSSIRRMDEPSADGKSVSCWSPTVNALDEHYSAGIGNKFFYTLAVGSGTSEWGTSTPCGGAAPVAGIGNEKAARIWYQALTAYMVSTTRYAGARQATLLAAADLYGPDSPEIRSVEAAWLAVGVDGAQPVDGTPSLLPIEKNSLTLRRGDPVRIQMSARDPQQQPLTFSATNLPAGVTIDPVSGLISGAPTARGRFWGYVVATDPDGNSAQVPLYLLIKGPPEFRSVTPEIDTQAGMGGVAVIRATVHDFDDDWVDPFMSMKITATGLPEGMTMNEDVPDGSVYDIFLSGLAKTPGTGTAVVTATDADGEQATASVPWRITPATLPGQPQNVTLSAGAGTVLIKWQPPAFVRGTAYPTGYLVRVAPGTETRAAPSARELHLTGLDVGRSYTVGIRSTSDVGDSAEQTFTLRPSSLTATATPALITHGQAVTLSGRANRAGAVVALEQRPAGQTSWSRVATVTAGAGGAWRYAVKPTTSTAYRVTTSGSAGWWPATSATVSTTVRYAVSIKASTTRPKPGQKVVISGVVRPARAGVVVTLQRQVGSLWGTVASVRTTAGGAYSFSRTFPLTAWNARVVVAGGAANAGAVSAPVRLVVK